MEFTPIQSQQQKPNTLTLLIHTSQFATFPNTLTLLILTSQFATFRFGVFAGNQGNWQHVHFYKRFS